jgi:spore coat polysaccharide biosynthesis predicted glycosyltransferase SpsG
MNALIVCHAGVGLGLGHLTRSIVVARALKDELGACVQLLIQGNPIQRPDLNRFEHRFISINENLCSAIEQEIRRIKAQVLVLDLYPQLIPDDIRNLLNRLRMDSCKVVSIDGLINYCDYLDMLFIPSFYFKPPEDFDAGNIPVLFGWDCYLLNVKGTPTNWRPGKKILVLTGGSDATGLGKTLPALLNERLHDGTELHWVTGPYAQEPVCPASPRLSMLNHQSPSGLDDLMVEANYAVTVYGVSFFELLYYGVPTVVFSPYGNKDNEELAAIARKGVAIVAKDEMDAVAKLKELMADDNLAASLSKSARQKMSASGGQKFARAVAALLEQP